MGLEYVVVLVTLMQMVLSQGPPPPNFLPPQCRGPPPGVDKPHECCKIPPFFTDEDFAECGFKKVEDEPEPHKRGPPDCTKQICILKKYDLVKDDEGAIDEEKLTSYMDEWTAKNPEFTEAVGKAKEQCIGKELPGPPHVCGPNKLVFCVTSSLFMNCPTWQDSEGCTAVKNQFEECKQYFNKA